MYSKQEASLLRSQFWTTFGQYMSPIMSAEGEKINWVNYKTGARDIRFIMNEDNQIATVAIELSHASIELQQQVYEQLQQLKIIFSKMVGDWQWQPLRTDEQGRTISQIFIQLDNVSIFNKEHWPTLISFFKTNLIALDQFWCDYKFIFQ